MDSLLKDIRYSVRGLLKRPGFTAMVVITLALGIGANTAIFSVLSALLFKPLPYPESDRLLAVSFENGQPNGYQFWSFPKYTAFRDSQSSFNSVAAYEQLQVTVDAYQPRRTEAEMVTSNYLPLLGIKPVLGTAFPETGETDQPLLLLSHRMWQREFGGDSQIVGRTVRVNRELFVIGGVLPEDFRGQSGTVECWVPVTMADRLKFKTALTTNAATWLKVIGRLKPQVNARQATAEMPLVSNRVAQLVPAQPNTLTANGQQSIKLVPLKDTKVDPAIRKSFLILQAVVLLLLAIACANTANMLLARSMLRKKEFAVRLAIGGSRWRVLRLVLTESLLLGLLGGAAGLLFTTWIVRWMTSAKPLNTIGFWTQYAQTFDYFSVSFDWSLLTFNFVLALLVGSLFGLAPAWAASRPRLNELLKHETGSPHAGFRSLRRFTLRGSLIATEIALSLVLLAGAGLLLKSLARLSNEKLGFEPKGVITTTADVNRKPLSFYEQLLDRIRNLPGVDKASLSLVTPLSGTHWGGDLEFEGQEIKGSRNGADFNVVTPEYFETLLISTLRGRTFTPNDRIGATRVVVVSREFAARYWPGQDPLGKRLKTPYRDSYGSQNSWIEVVGVVDDVKYGGVDETPEPALYLPAWQPLGSTEAVSLGPASISIRSSGDQSLLLSAIQREVRELDKSVPMFDSTSMKERAARVTSRYRYTTFFVSLFALVAVLLSATGTYGVMSFVVAANTRELGIRMALGAQRSEILKLVVGSSLIILVASLCLGVPAAFAATKVLKSQLYQISSSDPSTFIAVTLLIVMVALCGCLVPALRAMRLDPTEVLRCE